MLQFRIKMENLPNDLLFHIASFLDYKSLVRFGSSYRQVNSITKSDILWRRLCANVWLMKEKPTEMDNLSWRQVFIVFYSNWGKYVGFYAGLKKSWAKIWEIWRQKLPDLAQDLQPGCSESDLDEFEEKNSVKLPLDLRCSYRICNGQVSMSGLFGGIANYMSDTLRLLPMDQLIKPLKARSMNDFTFLAIGKDTSNFIYTSALLVVLTENDIQLKNSKLKNGMILTRRFESTHVAATNWAEFLKNFAEKLLPQYVVRDSKFLMRLCNSQNRKTGPFTVEVKMAFSHDVHFCDENPSHYDTPKNFYFLAVTLSMDAQADQYESGRLVLKHLEIIDPNGNVLMQNERNLEMGSSDEEFEFPELHPGNSDVWESVIDFKSRHVRFRGYFKLQRLYGRNSDNEYELIRIDFPEMDIVVPQKVDILFDDSD